MVRGSLSRVLAASLLPLALGPALPGCGQEDVKCFIDCEDASVPGSLFSKEYRDTTCEVCAAQFYDVRAFICGAGNNPNCRCLYFCQTLWEFKH